MNFTNSRGARESADVTIMVVERFMSSSRPVVIDTGTFDIHRRDMYIWKTVADKARGVISAARASIELITMLERILEIMATTTNWATIPR